MIRKKQENPLKISVFKGFSIDKKAFSAYNIISY